LLAANRSELAGLNERDEGPASRKLEKNVGLNVSANICATSLEMGKKSRRPSPKPAGPKNWAARESGKVIVFTREEILIRLIDTAIMLWFHNGDILSVHMLGSAAYKTLRDLTKKTGKVPWLTEIIGDEKLTIAYDFLRHAPSDLNVVLDFPPRANLVLLAGAVTTFEAVFNRRTNYMNVLMLRFLCRLSADTREGLLSAISRANISPRTLQLKIS
jgi:hypothetical protein